MIALCLLAGCAAGPDATVTPGKAAGEGGCRVVDVVDGDTLDIACGDTRERARLLGFDSPETYKPRCRAEGDLGRRATARMRTLLADARSVELGRLGLDRYDRRLTRLRVDGRDAAEIMVSEGLAIPYRGGPRTDWCERLT